MKSKDWSKQPFAFNAQEAIDYGVEEAILLNTIRQWLHYNESENKNIIDGYVWTYGTGEYYTKFLPFFNARKISRLLKSLLENGALITNNYNKFGADRTKWYSMPIEGKTDKKQSNRSTGTENPHLPNLANANTKSGECDLPDLANANTKSGKPIPINKTINNTVNKTKGASLPANVPEFIDQETFNEYLSWRKSKKLSCTKSVINRLVNKLKKFEESCAGDGQLALDNAITSGWKDIYQPKKTSQNDGITPNRNLSQSERNRLVLEELAREEGRSSCAANQAHRNGISGDPFDPFCGGVTING